MVRICIEDYDINDMLSKISYYYGTLPLFLGPDTGQYEIALVKSVLGLFVIAVFDTNPRTLIIGRFPDNTDPREIEKKIITEIVNKHCKIYVAMEALMKFMSENNASYTMLECEVTDECGHQCHIAD